MKLTKKIFAWLMALSCLGVLYAASAGSSRMHFYNRLPTIPEPPAAQAPGDSNTQLKYPMVDRTGDFVSDKSTDPFYLKDPSAIQENVEYDPATGMYVLTETVGGVAIKPPTYMTYSDYLKYTEKQDMDQYWKDRANAVNLVEEKSIVPPIDMKNHFVDRLFGSSKVEIKPQGNVEMTLGANIQQTANPNIPIRNRRTGGFNFDMNVNVNVVGKIGDKLTLGLKYNTQSGFQIDNQVKLAYTGGPDDIIKSIEAGNVSLPLPTRLITGSQSLFGVKTVLQFGRLTWSSVVSQQQSKKQSVTVQNGTQQQTFSITSDAYDVNKNFLLGQYFYNHYNSALSQLPNINSVVNITRIEVWETNTINATTNVRYAAGFMDLGESQPYEHSITPTSGKDLPNNGANNLYSKLNGNPSTRLLSNLVQTVTAPPFALQQGQDFEMQYVRKLNSNEYTYNAQLGYISLNSQPNPNAIIAVAYQYTYNGTVYQVGDFSDDIPPDSNAQASKLLFLKLLKGTGPRVDLPIWKLMMKNIYSLGAYNVSNQNFYLDVYYNDPGGGLKRYMPQGCIEGTPLLHLLNLDNLDMNNDPIPDGLFDFIPGVDILPSNGKLIFTVIEPFGQTLTSKFDACGSSSLAPTYTYQQLYDSTQFEAQQFPEYNRFVIKGTYQGSNPGQISLGAGNIPRGSVVVTSGGQTLKEGTDYTVDYNLGKVTIINQAIINSGQPIKIDFENSNQFNAVTQSMYATRLDYKVSKNFSIGGTLQTLGEKPFTQKVNIGNEPIHNTIMGVDVKYQLNLPWLTKALNFIYPTKEMSTLSTYGEFAYMQPGHSKAIDDPNHQPQMYIDDFEGTASGYDLTTPATNWHISSTPRNALNAQGQNMFPEGSLINNDLYGYNRALMSWYRIDNSFYNSQVAPAIVNNCTSCLNNLFERVVPYTEVFPNQSLGTLDQNLYTFDIAYYPTIRGPYNYEYRSGSDPRLPTHTYGIGSDGSLNNPSGRWGGIMEGMANTDFEATNVQYIEFWVLDPFVYSLTDYHGGDLYIDLGNISEDILQDSRTAFENGLSADTTTLDNTFWGVVPKLPPLVNAFDNDQNLRPIQDVGLDGMSDAEERARKQTFLQNVVNIGHINPTADSALQNDPSSDDYLYFDDPSYNNVSSILRRYRYFQGTEGNSPVQTNSIETTAETSLPDKEDVNNDNTMNQDEEYYQYHIHMTPNMQVGNTPYLITVQTGATDNSRNATARWLQFRIPIQSYESRTGDISDFTSIQFMRMFLTGWDLDSVILRFAELQLDRNQWITYDQSLDDGCEGVSPHAGGQPPSFSVTSVGLIANGSKQPVNYVIPPGVQRQQALGAQTNQLVAQDEQSLDLQACDLQQCQRKAVFKNMNLDLRYYKRLEMFIHANVVLNEPPVKDKQVTGFIRLGSDFTDNYYECEIPLLITPAGVYVNASNSDQLKVWPDSNNLQVNLPDLVALKEKRNAIANYPTTNVYTIVQANGNLLTIKGNPDLGAVKTVMLGIHNPSQSDPNNPLGKKATGQAVCVEVWFDELRVNGFIQKGGAAALATASVKMADLGTLNLAGNMHTAGFGQVDAQIDQRDKDNLYSYNTNTTLDFGKLTPKSLGFKIPFYGVYSESFSLPEYDPYQFDIPTPQMINIIRSTYGADSARKYAAQTKTINTTRGFNFTNARIVPKTKSKKPHLWDPGNFNFTYSFNDKSYSDPFTVLNSRKTWLGIIAWGFSPQNKPWVPFKKVIRSKSKWYDIIKELTINPIPSTLGVTSNWNRVLNTIALRSLGDVDFAIPTLYAKSFIWTRNYVFKYNPFKALTIDFTASDRALIDEPIGLLNTAAARNEVWHNVEQGGRNTNYTQNLAVNYALPINKIPLFDFITSSVGYASTYSWTALPWVSSPNPVDSAAGKLVQNPLGNIINNTQTDKAKAEFNMKKLYDKIPFLKEYDSPNPLAGDKKEMDKKREAVRKAREKIKQEIKKLLEQRQKLKQDLAQAKTDAKLDTTGKKAAEVKRLNAELKKNRLNIRQKRKELREKQYPSDPFISMIMRPLLSLKKVTADYKDNYATTLPGFQGYSRILGYDYQTNSPGWGFVFGGQPGDRFFKGGINPGIRNNWLNNAANKGWISTDTLLNQPFTQNHERRIDATAGFEPFPDFKIDFTLFRDYTDNYQEFFKYLADSIGSGYSYQHLNPMDMGSYTISYLPIRTLFAKMDSAGYYSIYNNFVANRAIISQRLGRLNAASRPGTAYYNPSDSLTNNGFADGYGPLSQDVLIPAFLAAYNKQNPNKIALNPFNAFPMPNWRISYNGLSKIKWIKKIFTSLTLTNGYNSTLTVSSFATNLNYGGSGSLVGAKTRDTLSGNFYSLYNIPSIVINEQFAPLIGVDITTKNNVTGKLAFNMSRTLTLSFSDFQMIELDSKGITAGAGYKIKGLKLPFKLPNGKKIRLNNDLNFRFDFSYLNNVTVNHLIDQGPPQITSGTETITISPSADYTVSKQLTLKLFFNQTRTIPKISTTYPTVNTQAGLTLRFNLAPQ